jgi:predicted N-acyltransferase
LKKAIRIQIYRDINKIEPAQWDSILDPEDIQASHRFIRVCQDSGVEDAQYWHCMFYQNRELVAIATFFKMNVSLDLLSGQKMRKIVGTTRRLWKSFLRIPMVFCGLPVSFGRSTIRFRKGVDHRPIIYRAAAEMEAIAEQEGVRVLCFKEFFADEVKLLEPLIPLGYFRAHSLPFCSLNISWSDFDTYVANLRAGYRRQVCAGLRKMDEQDLYSCVVQDFDPFVDQIFHLYQQVMDRAQYQLERLNRNFFKRLNASFSSGAQAILIMKGEEILTTAILLIGPKSVTFLLAGIDYNSNRKTGAYVHLLHEIVRFSIQKGAAWIDMGQTSYYLKRRLGAESIPVWVYLRHRNRIVHFLFKIFSRWLFPEMRLQPLRVWRAAKP